MIRKRKGWRIAPWYIRIFTSTARRLRWRYSVFIDTKLFKLMFPKKHKHIQDLEKEKLSLSKAVRKKQDEIMVFKARLKRLERERNKKQGGKQ